MLNRREVLTALTALPICEDSDVRRSRHSAFSLLDIRDYGAVPNRFDADVKNRIALNKARIDQIKTGYRIYIPEGTWYTAFPDEGGAILAPTDETMFALEGDGQGRTAIKTTNFQPTLGGSLFQPVHVSVDISKIRLEGPGAAGGITSTYHFCFGVVWSGGGPATGAFRDVYLTGWNQAVKSAPTDAKKGTKLLFERCHLGALAMGVLQGAGNDRDWAELVLRNCTLKVDEDTWDPNTPGEQPSYNLYVNSRVSLLVESCQFLGSTGRAIRRDSGGAPPIPYLPRFNKYVNSYFASPDGVETSYFGQTEITNCVIEGPSNPLEEARHGIIVNGPTVVTNSTIGTQGVSDTYYGISDDFGHNAEVRATNCTFRNGLYHIRRGGGSDEQTSTDKPWMFEGCKSENAHPGGAVALMLRGRLILRKHQFTTTTAARLLVLRGGTTQVCDSSNFGNKDIFINAAYGVPVTLDLSGTIFTNSGVQIGNATDGVVLTGSGNTFIEVSGMARGLAIPITGDIAGNLQPKIGLAGSVLAGGILSLSFNGDRFELSASGTPEVSDIEIFGEIPGPHNARITTMRALLIAVQPFVLKHNTGVAGSRILCKSGADTTVTGAVSLVRSPALDAWVQD